MRGLWQNWTKKYELAFCYSLHKEQIKGSGYVKETLIRSLHYKLQPFATFVFLFVIKTWINSSMQWGMNMVYYWKINLWVGYALFKKSKHKRKIYLDKNDLCDIFKPFNMQTNKSWSVLIFSYLKPYNEHEPASNEILRFEQSVVARCEGGCGERGLW